VVKGTERAWSCNRVLDTQFNSPGGILSTVVTLSTASEFGIICSPFLLECDPEPIGKHDWALSLIGGLMHVNDSHGHDWALPFGMRLLEVCLGNMSSIYSPLLINN
jgi:hypothetical protein